MEREKGWGKRASQDRCTREGHRKDMDLECRRKNQRDYKGRKRVAVSATLCINETTKKATNQKKGREGVVWGKKKIKNLKGREKKANHREHGSKSTRGSVRIWGTLGRKSKKRSEKTRRRVNYRVKIGGEGKGVPYWKNISTQV